MPLGGSAKDSPIASFTRAGLSCSGVGSELYLMNVLRILALGVSIYLLLRVWKGLGGSIYLIQRVWKALGDSICSIRYAARRPADPVKSCPCFILRTFLPRASYLDICFLCAPEGRIAPIGASRLRRSLTARLRRDRMIPKRITVGRVSLFPCICQAPCSLRARRAHCAYRRA